MAAVSRVIFFLKIVFLGWCNAVVSWKERFTALVARDRKKSAVPLGTKYLLQRAERALAASKFNDTSKLQCVQTRRERRTSVIGGPQASCNHTPLRGSKAQGKLSLRGGTAHRGSEAQVNLIIRRRRVNGERGRNSRSSCRYAAATWRHRCEREKPSALTLTILRARAYRWNSSGSYADVTLRGHAPMLGGCDTPVHRFCAYAPPGKEASLRSGPR